MKTEVPHCQAILDTEDVIMAYASGFNSISVILKGYPNPVEFDCRWGSDIPDILRYLCSGEEL